eukprot:4094525-Amphidinium_carterae.1
MASQAIARAPELGYEKCSARMPNLWARCKGKREGTAQCHSHHCACARLDDNTGLTDPQKHRR